MATHTPNDWVEAKIKRLPHAGWQNKIKTHMRDDKEKRNKNEINKLVGIFFFNFSLRHLSYLWQ